MISIIEKENKILVSSPYSSEYVARAKKLNGKWNPANRTWEFPSKALPVVRSLLIEVFGESDIPTAKKTIKIKAKNDISMLRNSIEAFGKTLARATGRDSGARVSDNVALISGDIGSEGSVKNWRTYISKDSIFQLYEVPVSLIQDSEDFEVIESKEEGQGADTMDKLLKDLLEEESLSNKMKERIKNVLALN